MSKPEACPNLNIFIITMASLFLLNLLAASSSYNTWSLYKSNSTGTSQQMGHSTAPPVSLTPAALKTEPSDRYGLKAEAEWSSLLPNGDHFAFVQFSPLGLPFEPSLYHQLRCISTLRTIFSYGTANTSEELAMSQAHHCLNYLRQAVLCNADTTLEPSFMFQLAENITTPAASGMEVVHTCRDWTQLRRFVEDNRAGYSGAAVSTEPEL